MKTITRCSISLLLALISPFLYAQTNFKLHDNNTGLDYTDGSTLYLRCDNLHGNFGGTYEYMSVTGLAADIIASGVSGPSGWTFSNDYANTTLNYIKSTPQDGTLTVTLSHSSSPYFSQTLHLYIKVSPVVTYASLPALSGNYSSGTVQIHVDDATYNPYSPWTSINYSTTYGLRINSNTSYVSNNPGGGASNDSQTLSTTSYGGTLYVTATNACATSTYIANPYATGTPHIASTTFNGSPGSSGTVSWVATLSLLTDGTATGANWNITSGSGTISPSGTSCNAYPSNFLRVVGTATNSGGSGEDATFYIWLQGYSPYRMAYPNPTTTTLTMDFDDAQMAQELVKEISLYNQKGKVVKSFDVSQAATYFRSTKSVIFDVRDLPKDTYFLHVQMADKLFENQIIVGQ